MSLSINRYYNYDPALVTKLLNRIKYEIKNIFVIVSLDSLLLVERVFIAGCCQMTAALLTPLSEKTKSWTLPSRGRSVHSRTLDIKLFNLLFVVYFSFVFSLIYLAWN